MSKKKILVLAMTLSMVAILAIGGTLAYFTATDSADNTFTVGGVKIELIEQQRNDDSTALEAFEDDKVLMPIVGSAQNGHEKVGGVEGLPTAENYVDKIITVKNVGTSAAYMKVYIAIPTALDNVSDASKNILHFNTTAASSVGGQWLAVELVAEGCDINDIAYNVYSRTYSSAVAADAATTTPAYIGFYLDKDVDMKEDGTYTIDGNVINFDFSEGVTIPVYAVGVQTAGFDSADAACDEAFGANYNPWAE